MFRMIKQLKFEKAAIALLVVVFLQACSTAQVTIEKLSYSQLKTGQLSYQPLKVSDTINENFSELARNFDSQIRSFFKENQIVLSPEAFYKMRVEILDYQISNRDYEAGDKFVLETQSQLFAVANIVDASGVVVWQARMNPRDLNKKEVAIPCRNNNLLEEIACGFAVEFVNNISGNDKDPYYHEYPPPVEPSLLFEGLFGDLESSLPSASCSEIGWFKCLGF